VKPLSIVYKRISELKPRRNNARTHSPKQLQMIARSIKQSEFLSPILIETDGTIICGHARLAAAKRLEIEQLPTICVSHLTAAEIRAFVIAENQITTKAGWDRELLSMELAEIADLDPALDLTITGFELEEIDLLLDIGEPRITPPFTSPPIDRSRPAVTRLGDLWIIGQHRLLCGDALEASSYRALLGKERADLVITDPPFNVRIRGHVSGLGAVKHPEFVQASGELSREQFRRFLVRALENAARASRSGSLHYIFMDWRSIADLIQAGEAIYDDFLNLIIWSKSSAGMGSLYRSQHELIALFKWGRRPHRNRVQLGANGRHRSNVWQYPGANTFGKSRDRDLALHPTVKNAEMIADTIKDASDPGDIVLDPFAGSGTTVIAAEQCRRAARMIELDPYYCDVIVRRAADCGLSAHLSNTGEEFSGVALSRAADHVLPEDPSHQGGRP